ncbi:hypothetical protein BGW38_010543 [Lunasporangiospora selenospora]|uniref:EXPERA domain-containing protein n=1 Tax=Lunasporangiospora selenospora TaxID=979761 RepID=A0A9P6KEU9_9FUNG|nr:hypothetical protein BGW38_010543 [Lunasporangiospora selenospora]
MAVAGAGFMGVALVAFVLIRTRRDSTLKGLANQGVFFWFLLSGTVHLVLELYYVRNHATLAGDLHPLAQIWKEYSLSDSRYLSSDALVLILESITTYIWGPVLFYAAWALYTDRPTRHVAQLVVSMGHVYSLSIYYLTGLVDGTEYGDPHPYYFWFYFVFFNVIWMVVPLALIAQSVKTIVHALSVVQKINQDKSKSKKKH